MKAAVMEQFDGPIPIREVADPACPDDGVVVAVAAPFILGCGLCGDCRAGSATICGQQHVIGFSGWGAFAERVAVPRADFNLVRLPDRLDYVEAAGLGCRVTTAWRALVDRAQVRPGEWVTADINARIRP